MSDVNTLLSQGRKAEDALDRNAAIDFYQQAVNAEPENRDACFRLANLLDQVGEEEEALLLMERACSEGDMPLNALVNLAILYEDNGQYTDAERALKLVLDTNPNDHRARIFMKDVQASKTMIIDDEARPRAFQLGVLNTPISDFELSARARNCLKKMDIRTIGDLLRISEAELMAYKNFGETTLSEIKMMLSQKGLRLGQAADQQHSDAREQVLQELSASVGDEAAGLLRQPIDDIDFSVRARKAMSLLSIETIGDLVSRTEAELLGIKNFGSNSLDEIKEKLAERGLGLRTIDS